MIHSKPTNYIKRACIDCEHYECDDLFETITGTEHRCKLDSDEFYEIDLVTGEREKTSDFEYSEHRCDRMRATVGLCGRHASFFKEKESS